MKTICRPRPPHALALLAPQGSPRSSAVCPCEVLHGGPARVKSWPWDSRGRGEWRCGWATSWEGRISSDTFRTFRPQRESQIAREHSLYFSSTTICSYDPFIKHLVSVFFSVFAQMCDGTELPSLDGSWCVVVEMSKLEIKDGVWLSSALLNWEVEHGLSEEMTFKQRKPSVKVESKFCGDLEKSFKSRRNSKYEVAMVDACLYSSRSGESANSEENEHWRSGE